jgi:CBS domain-containing protein
LEERPGEWSREERPWLGAGELGSRAGYGSAREAYGYGREGAARRIEIETAEPTRYPWGRYGPEWRGREWERGWPAGRTRWQREPLTAGEVMTRQIKAVTRRSTLANVAEIMKDENCGIVPVVDETHKLLGLITDRDIVIRTLAEGKSPGEVTVEHVMTDDVEAVRPDEELGDVVELMGRKQIRRVPVVNRDDRLVGIISMGDIANRADYDEDLQEALEKISAKRSFWSRLWS